MRDPAAARALSEPSMDLLEVLEPGLLTTVQDAGRSGLGALGVPQGGAADRRSLAIANLLLDNRPGAAALECTLAGPMLRLLAPTTIAIAGADLGAHIVETGERLRPGTARPVRAGWTIALPGPAVGGTRAYLAVPGGIDVPVLLESASTLLRAGFGGLDGRALRTGDVLRAAAASEGHPAHWPDTQARRPDASPVLRITSGPHADGFGDPCLAALTQTPWTVDHRSDRQGIRFDGPPLPGDWTGELATIGVLPGAIQVPPDGLPIALLADAQPTGGYPVPAVIIRTDLPALGQLGPGDVVRFAPVTPAEARAILRADRDAFEDALALLREAAHWDDLWHSAGG